MQGSETSKILGRVMYEVSTTRWDSPAPNKMAVLREIRGPYYNSLIEEPGRYDGIAELHNHSSCGEMCTCVTKWAPVLYVPDIMIE